MLISVKKTWESSTRPSVFVRANNVSLHIEGDSLYPLTLQMWQRFARMMG